MPVKQPTISDSKKQEIIEAANILDVAGQFLELKRVGNEWRTYSPLNEERTPSFYVNPEKNIFKDFSSGKGGNVVTFLIKVERFTYVDALLWLADFYQIDLDQTGPEKRSFKQARAKPKKQPKQEREPATIPDHIARQSFLPGQPFQKRLENNSFLRFLADQFGEDAAERLADYYMIGTTSKFGGSPIFWQIDQHQRFRFGKINAYKRDGHRTNLFTCFHKLEGTGLTIEQGKDFKPCLFGGHLIPDSSGPFGIVESEKTAIIASVYFPDITWLATASKEQLKAETLEPLKGKPVVLCPDLDATDQWQQLSNELQSKFKIKCSDLLIRNSSPEEIGQKGDLADFLLKFPVPEQQPPEPPEQPPEQAAPQELDAPLQNWFFQDAKGRKVSQDANDIQEAEFAMTGQNPALAKLVDRLGLKSDEVRTLNDEDLK